MPDKSKLDNSVFEQLTEIYLMALCIWAEARNQGLEGMQAVGSVILNRVRHPGWWGHDIKSVILAPRQFSWLNADDPQRVRAAEIAAHFIDHLHADPTLRDCWWIAKGLIEKWPETNGPALRSNVGDATYYHTLGCDPKWDDKMTKVAQIKEHIFYRDAIVLHV